MAKLKNRRKYRTIILGMNLKNPILYRFLIFDLWMGFRDFTSPLKSYAKLHVFGYFFWGKDPWVY